MKATPVSGHTQRHWGSSPLMRNTNPVFQTFLLLFQRPLLCEGCFVCSSFGKGCVRQFKYWLLRFRVKGFHLRVISARTANPLLIYRRAVAAAFHLPKIKRASNRPCFWKKWVAPPRLREYGLKSKLSSSTAVKISLKRLRHWCEGPVNKDSAAAVCFHWWRRRQTSSAWIVTLSGAPCLFPLLVRPSEITAGPLGLVTVTCLAFRLSSSPVRNNPWNPNSKLRAKRSHFLKRQ